METFILALIMGGWLSGIFVVGSFIEKLEERYAKRHNLRNRIMISRSDKPLIEEKKNMEVA